MEEKEKLELEKLSAKLATIEDQLKAYDVDVIEEIRKLCESKDKLSKKIKRIKKESTMTFEDKFIKWFYKDNDKNIDCYVPSNRTAMGRLVDFIGYENERRYETVRYDNEEFAAIFSLITDPEEFENSIEYSFGSAAKHWDIAKLKELIYEGAKEIMDDNEIGFKNDW